ncbi:MAG: CoA pyrophosphatase [Ilumatobacteraceae bacterium]
MIQYEAALRELLAANLANHEVLSIPGDDRLRAAVAIVVVDSEFERDDSTETFAGVDMTGVPGDLTGFDGGIRGVAGGAAFVLCRRAARMNRHSGQWALPGGKIDPGESVEEAALREIEEEIGLTIASSEILGRLDDYATRSGFVITPVVVWGGSDVELSPDPREVAQVLRIGLHELCRADSPRFVSIPESDRPVVQVPIGRDLVHAPTGAVLLQFRWVAIDGQAGARVNEFEQPVFAWR